MEPNNRKSNSKKSSNGRLDNLLRNEKSTPSKVFSRDPINETKRKISGICKSLLIDSSRYSPQKTVARINDYIQSEHVLDRILYSEISACIYSLTPEQRGTFATNSESLLYYALNEGSRVSEDNRKICIKIYDHFQLLLNQIENIDKMVQAGITDSIEDEKIKLHNEIKGVEKEYISILGIFASIVLAFTGGMTFSSSVLENISSVSIYRICLITLVLGVVLFDLIWLLIDFIRGLNGQSIRKKWMVIAFNILFIAGIIFTCLAYKCDWFSRENGSIQPPVQTAESATAS